LKDVSFDIKSGKKFGICGRSGSGKSTLISTLLRIEDPTVGTIKIDDVELNTLTRSTVRERIICLPQDAMLFPRSFRFNLDPGGDVFVEDEKIFEYALRLAGLWDLVDERGGLSGEVEPQSLSHGEKQLLALARAVIRRKLQNGQCILVLDEATSSLDDDTQAKFQEIIDTEFKSNTVISVAHRLETLKYFDEILVLHKGKVEKIGSPAEVL
jgi:ATP-binding cassette, subfamily C (CFTR/MRP), member 1